jgi:hypothetical protein
MLTFGIRLGLVILLRLSLLHEVCVNFYCINAKWFRRFATFSSTTRTSDVGMSTCHAVL